METTIALETLTQFEMADQLRTAEDIAEYLSAVLADGDSDELLSAIGHVAKSSGMTKIAESSGLGRESLYKALRPGAKPQFDTVVKVLAALGIQLHAVARSA